MNEPLPWTNCEFFEMCIHFGAVKVVSEGRVRDAGYRGPPRAIIVGGRIGRIRCLTSIKWIRMMFVCQCFMVAGRFFGKRSIMIEEVSQIQASTRPSAALDVVSLSISICSEMPLQADRSTAGDAGGKICNH